MLYLNTIAVSCLQYITKIEKILQWYIFKHIKIICLKKLISEKNYIDNQITNIICTKLDKYNNCERALSKIDKRKSNIFRLSPRGLVFCVLNKNYKMLQKIKELGYPLEMIIYAENYHLIKKRHMENFISLLEE